MRDHPKSTAPSEPNAFTPSFLLRLDPQDDRAVLELRRGADLELDALTYPTGNVPAPVLGAPYEPSVNGRNGGSSWNLFGREGFPIITVPAGFTSQVYDRVRDPDSEDGTLIVGPVDARLPIGIDFVARPFAEPTILRIASAYEAATRHRAPPTGFGPLPEEEKMGSVAN